MSLPQPSSEVSYEEFLDMLAYLLATDPRTSEIAWIVGDVGMGAAQKTPFAYIAPRNDKVKWSTTGGLSSGPTGVDDHEMQVPITVAFEPHTYLDPVTASPPEGSPLSEATLKAPPPFLEQPGYRESMNLSEEIRAVLRSNITLNGEIATSTIVESTYVLQVIDSKLYRAARITVVAQQRRRRG